MRRTASSSRGPRHHAQYRRSRCHRCCSRAGARLAVCLEPRPPPPQCRSLRQGAEAHRDPHGTLLVATTWRAQRDQASPARALGGRRHACAPKPAPGVLPAVGTAHAPPLARRAIARAAAAHTASAGAVHAPQTAPMHAGQMAAVRVRRTVQPAGVEWLHRWALCRQMSRLSRAAERRCERTVARRCPYPPSRSHWLRSRCGRCATLWSAHAEHPAVAPASGAIGWWLAAPAVAVAVGGQPRQGVEKCLAHGPAGETTAATGRAAAAAHARAAARAAAACTEHMETAVACTLQAVVHGSVAAAADTAKAAAHVPGVVAHTPAAAAPRSRVAGLAPCSHAGSASAVSVCLGVVAEEVHLLVEVDRLHDGGQHRLDGEGRRELRVARLQAQKNRLPGRLDPQPNPVLEFLGQVEKGLELA
eukprot:scaffold4173_cov117-Isochrysis_galbana.AAC.13